MSTRPDHIWRRRMEDDVSRGQKRGSVEVSHQYLGKYSDIVCQSFMKVREIFLVVFFFSRRYTEKCHFRQVVENKNI